ncbi:MAG: CubicO group peptidase (beta-lactamase class C family) [Spirosomataceae bacterium]|jgi:CubicO group peptidase (beta-lactamase class C family)
MKNRSILLTLIMTLAVTAFAQKPVSYLGNWEGKMSNSNAFNFTVELTNFDSEKPTFTVSNDQRIFSHSFTKKKDELISFRVNESLSFQGKLTEKGRAIRGFVQSGILQYHVTLQKSGNDSFSGNWNVFMVDELKSNDFYLSVEGDDDDYQVYPILGDNRFTGTWCMGYQQDNEAVAFSDFKTGLNFEAKLLLNAIHLSVYLGGGLIDEIDFKKSETDWKTGDFTSKKANKNKLQLDEMESLISDKTFVNTHGVVVSKKGKTIYEKYFDGYNANTPHDTRSASKSLSSAVVGIAKDKGLFQSVDQSIFDFIPDDYQSFKTDEKAKIDIKSLLTMSSGLDANDSKRNSAANENTYQPTPDWLKTVLSASMINEPNTHANYGSANPFLLGIAMNSVVEEPLALFMDQNLFQPLGISNYIIQNDNVNQPYFGGGMYLTPSQMLTFGELYLNNGKHKGKQIISKAWVKSSFTNYRNLENVNDKNGYGYLWWHKEYTVNGKTIKSIEARGNGGQYIFIVPELQVVAVITSGNYQSNKSQQPEAIFEQYILPALVK